MTLPATEETNERPAFARIRSSSPWSFPDLGEVIRSRELVWFLVWRDIKVRYKQTAIGLAWVVIQPLLTTLIMTAVLGRIPQLNASNLPYPAFVMCALLPWQLFSHTLSTASNSLVVNERLITKVYLPRIIIPLASVLVGGVDLCVNAVTLVIFLCVYRVWAGSAILWLPLMLFQCFAVSIGVALWTSALNVRYRDVRQAMPFLTQLWFFASPIAYGLNVIPVRWQALASLNPMVGIIEGFRWCVTGMTVWPGTAIGMSVPVSCIVLLTGAIYFRRAERGFADVM